MEVHHHSHTSRKKWTHYIWEFLMLFLAVFCGFLAENQREHYIENIKEKEYVSSMIKDLQLDTASLSRSLKRRQLYIEYFDSLIHMLRTDPAKNTNDIYFYARHTSRSAGFTYNDRTIEQLKSSGNFRLIRKRGVSDSLFKYDNTYIKSILNQQQAELEGRHFIRTQLTGKIFNGFIWDSMVDENGTIKRLEENPRLLTSDAVLINDFVLQVSTLKVAYTISRNEVLAALAYAERLIPFLKQQYRFK